MLNLAETQAITNLFWQEWFPQIVYDVHQMGQSGARFVIPVLRSAESADPAVDTSRGRSGRLQDGRGPAGEEHRGRRDEHDLRYVVARRISFGRIFQLDRHLVRGGKCRSDVARHDHKEQMQRSRPLVV